MGPRARQEQDAPRTEPRRAPPHQRREGRQLQASTRAGRLLRRGRCRRWRSNCWLPSRLLVTEQKPQREPPHLATPRPAWTCWVPGAGGCLCPPSPHLAMPQGRRLCPKPSPRPSARWRPEGRRAGATGACSAAPRAWLQGHLRRALRSPPEGKGGDEASPGRRAQPHLRPASHTGALPGAGVPYTGPVSTLRGLALSPCTG